MQEENIDFSCLTNGLGKLFIAFLKIAAVIGVIYVLGGYILTIIIYLAAILFFYFLTFDMFKFLEPVNNSVVKYFTEKGKTIKENTAKATSDFSSVDKKIGCISGILLALLNKVRINNDQVKRVVVSTSHLTWSNAFYMTIAFVIILVEKIVEFAKYLLKKIIRLKDFLYDLFHIEDFLNLGPLRWTRFMYKVYIYRPVHIFFRDLYNKYEEKIIEWKLIQWFLIIGFVMYAVGMEFFALMSPVLIASGYALFGFLSYGIKLWLFPKMINHYNKHSSNMKEVKYFDNRDEPTRKMYAWFKSLEPFIYARHIVDNIKETTIAILVRFKELLRELKNWFLLKMPWNDMVIDEENKLTFREKLNAIIKKERKWLENFNNPVVITLTILLIIIVICIISKI